MDTIDSSRATSLDDIVFEHRNKSYGAFELRKRYEKHAIIGMLFAVALFIVFVLIAVIDFSSGEEDLTDDVKRVISISDLAPPPPIEKIPPPPEFKLPPPPKKTIKFVAPKVTDEVVPEEKEMPTMKEVEEAPVISTETVDLPDPGNVTFEEAPAEIGDMNNEPKVYRYVGQMPEFPGGTEQLYRFLGRNTRYPESARRAGIEGTVYVTFVVRSDGSISNIEIKKGLTEDINQEVIRVIKKMPDWSPGKQNGRAVNVQYILPYVFKIK